MADGRWRMGGRRMADGATQATFYHHTAQCTMYTPHTALHTTRCTLHTATLHTSLLSNFLCALAGPGWLFWMKRIRHHGSSHEGIHSSYYILHDATSTHDGTENALHC